MEFDVHRRIDRDEQVYTLTIRGIDLSLAKFTQFDRMLLNDVNNGEDVTIADHLLALEMMARRVEEAVARRRKCEEPSEPK